VDWSIYSSIPDLYSSIPIPDLVSVPLGITKYSPWKFGTAIFTGKFIFNEVIVWSAVILGRPFINRQGLLGLSTINSTYLVTAIVIGVVTVAVIIYLSLRIDWAKIIGKWFPWTLDIVDVRNYVWTNKDNPY